MSEMNSTILESRPALKKDLLSFLSDTDAWIIAELKNAHGAKDWGKVRNVIDIMESVNNLSHSH